MTEQRETGGQQRRFLRIPFEGRMKILAPEGDFEVQVVDISLKGLLAERPTGWQGDAGDQQTLKIILAEGEEEITMTADVVHLSETHIGFVWKDIGFEDFGRLRRLLELNLASETLLEREFRELLSGHL